MKTLKNLKHIFLISCMGSAACIQAQADEMSMSGFMEGGKLILRAGAGYTLSGKKGSGSDLMSKGLTNAQEALAKSLADNYKMKNKSEVMPSLSVLYKMDNQFGIEAAYSVNKQKLSFEPETSKLKKGSAGTYNQSTFRLMGLGFMPLDDKVDLFAGLGAVYMYNSNDKGKMMEALKKPNTPAQKAKLKVPNHVTPAAQLGVMCSIDDNWSVDGSLTYTMTNKKKVKYTHMYSDTSYAQAKFKPKHSPLMFHVNVGYNFTM
ncbi:MAG: outer membrane beta-barrel protein [Endozoicomonadaceae bacterium]|nr:outer membrane beta-barrel protein [Endozoicomonadaceae bacterium]